MRVLMGAKNTPDLPLTESSVHKKCFFPFPRTSHFPEHLQRRFRQFSQLRPPPRRSCSINPLPDSCILLILPRRGYSNLRAQFSRGENTAKNFSYLENGRGERRGGRGRSCLTARCKQHDWTHNRRICVQFSLLISHNIASKYFLMEEMSFDFVPIPNDYPHLFFQIYKVHGFQGTGYDAGRS